MRDGIYSFAMQCIGWSVEHLPVTHLEIVMLAYAATSVVIFIFWWNKPFNIRRPVRVSRKSELGVTDSVSKLMIQEILSQERCSSRSENRSQSNRN